jgi:hypothetical protein
MNLKVFDLFQKTTIDNINQPTYIGSILSFISIALILYLLIQEFFIFLTPLVMKDTIIMNEKNYFPEKNFDFIFLNFSIIFTNSPCSILSVDREELIGTHYENLNVTKSGFDRQNNLIPEYFPYKTNLLTNSLENSERCEISGLVNLTKSPGDIHFSFHPYLDIYDKFIKSHPKYSSLIRLSHTIKGFNFNQLDKDDLNAINKRFGGEISNLLTQGKRFPDHGKDSQSFNYEYYLVLVPYLLMDESEVINYFTYVYSISQVKRLNNNTAEMPMVMMNYDISNVGMRYVLKPRDIFHSLTHVCAIVGGVYVIFCILNRIILAFFDYASNNRKD